MTFSLIKHLYVILYSSLLLSVLRKFFPSTILLTFFLRLSSSSVSCCNWFQKFDLCLSLFFLSSSKRNISLEHSFLPKIAFLPRHHFWSLCNVELNQLWFFICLYKDVHYLITCVYIFGNLWDESCLLLTYSSLYFVYSWCKSFTWPFLAFANWFV